MSSTLELVTGPRRFKSTRSPCQHLTPTPDCLGCRIPLASGTCPLQSGTPTRHLLAVDSENDGPR
jgi:hypothetical protein